MQETYDAIIIGAGHNGLVASWYLANAGWNVLVLERREIVGGACVTEELWPGFSVPTCSYVCYLLQDKVIRDMRLRDFGFAVLTSTQDSSARFQTDAISSPGMTPTELPLKSTGSQARMLRPIRGTVRYASAWPA